jgi:hypothetical protein
MTSPNTNIEEILLNYTFSSMIVKYLSPVDLQEIIESAKFIEAKTQLEALITVAKIEELNEFSYC